MREHCSQSRRAASGLAGIELIIRHQPIMLPRWIEHGSSRALPSLASRFHARSPQVAGSPTQDCATISDTRDRSLPWPISRSPRPVSGIALPVHREDSFLRAFFFSLSKQAERAANRRHSCPTFRRLSGFGHPRPKLATRVFRRSWRGQPRDLSARRRIRACAAAANSWR